MTKMETELTQRHRVLRAIGYLCLLAFGVVLSAMFIDAEPARDAGRSVYRKLQAFVWDEWNKGSIGWGNYVLSVPVGEYGWIVHEDSDLSVFSRKSQGIVSIVLKKSDRAKWPYYEHSKHLCEKRKLCSQFERRSTTIAGRQVDFVRFQDTSPGIDVRSNAYIYLPSPEILVSIGAEIAAELDSGVKMSVIFLEQIASQANSADRLGGTQPK